MQFSEETNTSDVVPLASDSETNLEGIKYENTVNNGGREIKVEQNYSSISCNEPDFGGKTELFSPIILFCIN